MPMTPIQPSGRTASGGHEGAKRSTPLGVPDAIATRARGRERRRAEPRARWTFTDRDATRDDIPRRALCAHDADGDGFLDRTELWTARNHIPLNIESLRPK